MEIETLSKHALDRDKQKKRKEKRKKNKLKSWPTKYRVMSEACGRRLDQKYL